MDKLEPTKEEVRMGSPSKSNTPRWLNQVQGMCATSSNVKGKLEPTNDYIPKGSPSRSNKLRRSNQVQVDTSTTSSNK
jgi:hypothetical protein